jgi:RNA polymerase sigma-70 factor, ECF subfamily
VAGVTATPIEVVVDDAVARARAAWPGLRLDGDAFRRGLHERVARDGALALAELCVEDLYLAQACAQGDPEALAILDREHLRDVPAWLARHPARAEADEVAQLVRERLLLPRDGAPARIAEYSGRGRLASWLRVTVLRAASNLTRGERPRVELDDSQHEPAVLDVPQLRHLEERYREPFRVAFRAAFDELPADERSMLKLHFVHGVGVRQLGPILGVSHATAARRIRTSQERLGELVLTRLGELVNARPDELESVVRAMISRLDVSLTSLPAAR